MIGAAHVVISCLRLVAFMYNRQQKWLYEEDLPDLALLRRLLRLGPQRVGEDISSRGSLLLACVVVVVVWLLLLADPVFRAAS